MDPDTFFLKKKSLFIISNFQKLGRVRIGNPAASNMMPIYLVDWLVDCYLVQIDWIEKAWPRHLKELQEDNTNNIEEMMYPKVKRLIILIVNNYNYNFLTA